MGVHAVARRMPQSLRIQKRRQAAAEAQGGHHEEDRQGITPFDSARGSGHSEIIKLTRGLEDAFCGA